GSGRFWKCSGRKNGPRSITRMRHPGWFLKARSEKASAQKPDPTMTKSYFTSSRARFHSVLERKKTGSMTCCPAGDCGPGVGYPCWSFGESAAAPICVSPREGPSEESDRLPARSEENSKSPARV